jgi:hypothetical protein
MLSKEEYEKFKSGKMIYDLDSSKIISKEEALKDAEETFEKYYNKEGIDKEEKIEEILEDSFKTFDNFSDGYEDFYQEYTTASGEVVIAIGYYGMDN